jgi:hypothetical protein
MNTVRSAKLEQASEVAMIADQQFYLSLKGYRFSRSCEGG